ncbi:hypothetical protein CYMTET_31869, partial [Cymbomonas tetramitiformis]
LREQSQLPSKQEAEFLEEMGYKDEVEKADDARMGTAFLVLSTLAYVLSAMFLAIVCDQLAVVFDFFGAICGSFEVLIAPALFWMVLGPNPVQSRKVLGTLIVVLGLVVMVGGLYSTIKTEL